LIKRKAVWLLKKFGVTYILEWKSRHETSMRPPAPAPGKWRDRLLQEDFPVETPAAASCRSYVFFPGASASSRFPGMEEATPASAGPTTRPAATAPNDLARMLGGGGGDLGCVLGGGGCRELVGRKKQGREEGLALRREEDITPPPRARRSRRRCCSSTPKKRRWRGMAAGGVPCLTAPPCGHLRRVAAERLSLPRVAAGAPRPWPPWGGGPTRGGRHGEEGHGPSGRRGRGARGGGRDPSTGHGEEGPLLLPRRGSSTCTQPGGSRGAPGQGTRGGGMAALPGGAAELLHLRRCTSPLRATVPTMLRVRPLHIDFELRCNTLKFMDFRMLLGKIIKQWFFL
jgi:hypothetical protein